MANGLLQNEESLNTPLTSLQPEKEEEEEKRSVYPRTERKELLPPREIEAKRLINRTEKAKEIKRAKRTFEEKEPKYFQKDSERKKMYTPAEVAGLPKIGNSESEKPFKLYPQVQNTLAPGPDNLATDTVNFLFGGEMAVTGFKYDTSGLSWDIDNMKQQWSEAPLWVNILNVASLAGTMAFPAARAAYLTTRFGKVGSLLGRFGDDATELQKFKDIGLLDKNITSLDGKARMKLRQQEVWRGGYEDLKSKLELHLKGEGEFGPMDKFRLQFAKRFSNDYYKIANSLQDGQEDARQFFYKNLDELSRSEDIGKFFINMPTGEEAGKRIYQNWMHKIRPGLFAAPKLAASEKKWADSLEIAMRAHQQEALKHGMITQKTIDKVGEVHVPKLLKDSRAADLSTTRSTYMPITRKATKKEIAEGLVEKGDEVTVFRPFDTPRLDSPTLKPRKAELDEVYNKLLAGELITDPAELTIRGYVTDRLLLNNYKVVTDIATNSKFANKGGDLLEKYGSRDAAKKAGWVPLDSLAGQLPTTLKRMVKKKDASYLDADDALPWVRKTVFDDMFGSEGIFAQAIMSRNMLDLLTMIHKTSKTAFSIPTHFQNFTSNIAMLSQAGWNALSPTNINTQIISAKAFEKISKAYRMQKDLGKGATNLEDIGVKLGKHKIGDKVLDLDEEIFDPRVRALIEESAFESVEGFSNIGNLLKNLRDEQRLTKSMAEKAIKAKEVMQLGDKKGFRWFDKMTKWYLGEDMVPKMSYYLSLRSQGLTKEAAILEVGRRLPMYQTVGSSIKQGRRYAFPWATFPVEATRITKNNLMDHPLRMVPWLQMPNIMQSVFHAAGFAPGAEEVEGRKKWLPPWAQRGTTILGEGGAIAAMEGGTTGAIGGAAVGGRFGGVKGAIAGGVLGAAAGGAGMQALTDEQHSDQIRGAVLDFLPHSATFLTTVSRDFGGGPPSEGIMQSLMPFKDLPGFVEQLPAEPMAIAKPFMDIFAGKTAFGQEVSGGGVGDSFGKGIAGLIGTMMPPFIQKYGLKVTTPDVSLMEATIGKQVPGDITNVSRFLIDTGQSMDPVTGKPGSFTLDYVLNNSSAIKSWATDPANALTNESLTEKHLKKVRSYLTKNLAFYLENGDEKETVRTLNLVMKSFSQQYSNDPYLANQKYTKWLENRSKMLGRHPALRSWSEEELKSRLSKVSAFAGDVRGKGRDEMRNYLLNLLNVRGMKNYQTTMAELSSEQESTTKEGLL